MALLNRSSDTRAMRAVARQREKYTHDVKTGDHTLTVDEPVESGGQDEGPSPQELLAAALAVDVEYTPAERGCPTRFDLVLKMPSHLDEEQIEKLRVIAAKCPVHRTLEGEVMFEERVKLA